MPDTPETSGPSNRTLRRVGIGAAIVALVIAGGGIAMRMGAVDDLEATAAEAAVPTVAVVRPQGGLTGDALVLPGDVQAYNSAAINARTNGYVRRWLADIGDRVAAGQTLAILDAPEVDQQLAQAQADYKTALANRRLAQTSAERWRTMLAKDAVSKQETDEREGDFAARTAVANAALANVRRLQALQDFTRLRAPFAGIVTSRSAQIGALVVAGNAAAQPLFTISDVHRVRIYVRVPQGYATQVRPGLNATLSLPEQPGRDITATVTRSARAVDTQSGAVLVQLEAPNDDGTLMPGAFAQVRFRVDPVAGSLRLPGSAVLYGNDGPTVAVVERGGTVRVKPIEIARDEGRVILVSRGLAQTDSVIDTPPDSIRNGDRVRVQQPAAAQKAAPRA